MINKIKAMFAAIGSIGVLMFIVSAFLWVLTNYTSDTIHFCLVFLFVYSGYGMYKFFLKYFKDQNNDEQINS